MDALRRAEAQKGAPVYLCEVSQAWNSLMPKVATPFILAGLQDLYRNDEVLCDLEINLFTLNPEHQRTEDNGKVFEVFSDRMARLYPTYEFDPKGRARPGPDTPRTNLRELKELLLSKDLERNAELDWVTP